MHGQNAPNWAILGEQGEFCTGDAADGGVLGEFCTGDAADGGVLGEFCTAHAVRGGVLGEFSAELLRDGPQWADFLRKNR